MGNKRKCKQNFSIHRITKGNFHDFFDVSVVFRCFGSTTIETENQKEQCADIFAKITLIPKKGIQNVSNFQLRLSLPNGWYFVRKDRFRNSLYLKSSILAFSFPKESEKVIRLYYRGENYPIYPLRAVNFDSVPMEVLEIQGYAFL